ncbi:MAG: DUF3192 domain-containing protein [Pseudomonadota bacterium]
MSRNVIAVLVVISAIGGIKGAQWLYNEATGGNEVIDSQNWENRELMNRKAIQSLQLGAPLVQITELMGTADFNEIMLSGEEKYQVLFYRTQRTTEDGMTTKDECTPLIFSGQVLVGWGHDFFNSLSPESLL